MAEYIERDVFINNELIPLVKQLDLCHPKQKKGVLMAIQKLNETPTADVVKVVRCKDCVYLRESEKTNRVFCLYHGDDYEFETHQNKFCSDGVKAKLKEREGK